MPKVGHILIINQERSIADVIIEILADAGYRAYTVRDSADALAVIVTVPPALILLDIGRQLMPDAVLIDQVRAAGFEAIPIVVMATTPNALEPFRVPSVVECLATPFEIDDLLACVARYVRPQTIERTVNSHRAILSEPENQRTQEPSTSRPSASMPVYN